MLTTFTPKIEELDSIEPVVEEKVIAEEPMLFSASPEFAVTNGGPLTRNAMKEIWACAISRIPIVPGTQWVIDTRSHMLMPGHFPAIGGWHCDAVPRPSYTSQPDVRKLDPRVLNITVHVSTSASGVSNTEFVDEPFAMDVDVERVWPSVHKEIKLYGYRVLKRTPGPGKIVSFTMPTIHRATPATERGWRWWLRATMYPRPPKNQIRRQVQVYTSSEGAGW